VLALAAVLSPWVGVAAGRQVGAPPLLAAAVARPLSATDGSWTAPLPGPLRVVRRFDPPASRYSVGHRGVDLAGRPGTPVLAAGAGTVAFAGVLAGRGVVSLAHAGGLRTTYEPVAGVLVSGGQRVAEGQALGVLAAGHPGCASAACLHWGLRRGAGGAVTYLDPLLLLGRGPVRLLPLAGLPP